MRIGRRLAPGMLAFAIASLPAIASAQSHYLLARTNGSFHGSSTSDPNVDHVDHLDQNGVGGVNPSFHSIFASADSASGVMTISGGWSLGGGAPDPIQPPTTYHSATRIAENLDPGTPFGGSVIVHATLVWGGGASMTSADVERTDLSALVKVGDCQAYFRRRIYSSIYPAEDNPIGCSNSTSVGTASAGAIQVEMVYPSVAITPSTSFHVDAQLAADIDNPVEYFDSGQYQVSGTLSVEIEGTDTYQWTTPSFLTVPEPASALTGELAFAGVLALAWARRS